MLNSSEHVQSILSDDANKFDSGEGHLVLQPLVGENSLLTLDGEKHKQHKNLIKPQFYGEHLRKYGDAMRDVTMRHMSKIPRGDAFFGAWIDAENIHECDFEYCVWTRQRS